MEILLSPTCKSLTGTLGRGFGYYIRSTKKGRFFGQRSKHDVPPEGHWRFILTCAVLAQAKLHIGDIRIEWEELQSALYEAKYFIASEMVRRNYTDKNKVWYDARDVLNIKTTFGL